MVVIIDNYDSFTYNLAHLVKELGVAVDVLRNDQFSIEELEQYDKIILSPGPGVPEEAGLLLDVIRTYAGKKPILGVCLGEQAIGQAFGGKLVNLSTVFHGVQTIIRLTEPDYIFRGFRMKLYASDIIFPMFQRHNLPFGTDSCNGKRFGQFFSIYYPGVIASYGYFFG